MVGSPLDLRILRYISENGVLESEREIARKLKISPSTLSFKLRKFEDKRIVTAYKYRIDFSKLGLSQIAWVFLTIKYGNKKSIKQVMDELLKFPEIHVCLYTSGKNNICVKIFGKSKSEIEKFTEKLEKEFGEIIESSEKFFVEKQLKSHNRKNEEINANYKADKIDLLILAEKMLNPKSSLNEVAKKLEMHRNTVSSRWNEMLKNKIIVKKTPIINPDLHRELGMDFMAISLIKANPGKKENLAEELMNLNEVHELNKINENPKYDLFAIIRTNDLNAHYKISDKFFFEKRFSEAIQEASFSIVIRSDSRRHTYLQDLGLEKFIETNQF